jgi:hypothetical protein
MGAGMGIGVPDKWRFQPSPILIIDNSNNFIKTIIMIVIIIACF